MKSVYLNRDLPPEAPVSCDNCDWRGVSGDLDKVDDIDQRLDPGGVVPAGQCPVDGCQSFAYLDPPRSITIRVPALLVGRLEAMFSYMQNEANCAHGMGVEEDICTLLARIKVQFSPEEVTRLDYEPESAERSPV